jgi:hypothetical protein
MDRRSALGLASLAGLAACLPRNALAEQKTLDDQIVGLWRLTSHTNKVVGTGALEYPFGEHPTSYQLFGRGGEMLNLIMGEDRKGPAGTSLTDAEKLALFNSCVAQIGTYKIEGNKIIYHYVATLAKVEDGTERTYAAEMAGSNKLTLRASTFLQRRTGHQVITIRTFERAA